MPQCPIAGDANDCLLRMPNADFIDNGVLQTVQCTLDTMPVGSELWTCTDRIFKDP